MMWIRTLCSLVFLIFTNCCEGQTLVVGPSGPIVALIGGDITLPCHLEPSSDVSSDTLEWSRPDLTPRFVHLRRGGVELLLSKHPSYQGRTSLSSDRMKCGDISLRVSTVRLSDEGKYQCHIPNMGMSVVQLVVGAASSHVVITANVTTSGKLELQCESAGWYPEPDLSWLDSEGHILSAGPTETLRRLDGLYTVSSRLTVENGTSFTCRVHQKDINQTRTTEIHIQGEESISPTCSDDHQHIIIIIIILIVFIMTSAGFLLWKIRQRKINEKTQHENVAECGQAEERKSLFTEDPEMKDLNEEKNKEDERLKEKEEDEKLMDEMIRMMKDNKEELENYRDKKKPELEKVERQIWEKEREIQELEKSWALLKGTKQRRLKEEKTELEKKKSDFQQGFQSITEILKRKEDIYKNMIERRNKVMNQIKQSDETKQEETGQTGTEETKQGTESMTAKDDHFKEQEQTPTTHTTLC